MYLALLTDFNNSSKSDLYTIKIKTVLYYLLNILSSYCQYYTYFNHKINKSLYKYYLSNNLFLRFRVKFAFLYVC